MRCPLIRSAGLAVLLSWMTGFLPGAAGQDYVEPMSRSIHSLYQSLQDEIPLTEPQILEAMRLGAAWLEGLETLQTNLRHGQTGGLAAWLTRWNGISRATGPATLLTHSAQSLRSSIARNSLWPRRLRESLPGLRRLADELVLEMQAWDRIERFRRRDTVLRVVDAQGRPIPGAEVTIHQIRPDFLFGCNLFAWNDDETDWQLQYRKQFAALLNYATLGFYWWSYEPASGKTREDHWRRVAEWCRQHNIQTKGHTLLWNYTEPKWLPDDPKQLYEAQMSRITREMTHFAGLVDDPAQCQLR
ncbi:MAG: endo-1,4-beta-xylanase, partial [bacterium]